MAQLFRHPRLHADSPTMNQVNAEGEAPDIRSQLGQNWEILVDRHMATITWFGEIPQQMTVPVDAIPGLQALADIVQDFTRYRVKPEVEDAVRIIETMVANPSLLGSLTPDARRGIEELLADLPRNGRSTMMWHSRVSWEEV